VGAEEQGEYLKIRGRRKLQNEELQKLYSSLNVRVTRSRGMIRPRNVQKRNVKF
jgi:hypothetical protein